MSETKTKGSVVIGGIRLAAKLIWVALVVATPLLGVWFASSLAAYLDGPTWAVVAAAVLLFPGLPLVWEGWSARRFGRKAARAEEAGDGPPKRYLGLGDRFVLRTLAVNLGFLAVLIATFPLQGFTAVASRGDWFLDHLELEAAQADLARRGVFRVAGGLEWAYEWARENPYEAMVEEGEGERVVPTAEEIERGVRAKAETRGEELPEVAEVEEAEEGPEAERASLWPLPAELHPVVAEMPAEVETGYGDVARYIAARESDPYQRVKALHDWVADRVVYDVAAIRGGPRPMQDPLTVFRTRKAVCAGYANLLTAMGEITGDEIETVVGVSRDQSGGVAGGGHAWNAVRIEGSWYLIDATWNAGSVNDGEPFKKGYGTDYLFTPPEVFGADHFPDDPLWQLRPQPITRGEFIRQPMLRPGFHGEGLRLVSPTRSQVGVPRRFEVRLENPRGRAISATMVPRDGGVESRCEVVRGRETRLRCAASGSGIYRVRIFAGEPGASMLPMVGQLEVVAE